MRLLIAAASGGLFGLGLMISGMTDPRKVQGWLDIFGAWDPTLAFVMGGAILPMLLAWQLTRARKPLVGGEFPAKPAQEIDHNLIIGSVFFGLGWGLVGLCPGPALASMGYGTPGVWVFTASMIAGMVVAPKAQRALDARLATG